MVRSVTRGGLVMVELVRLGTVVATTAAGYALGPQIDGAVNRGDPGATQLVSSVLGALLGYLVGGWLGRVLVRGVGEAEERLRKVEAAVLVTTLLGAATFGVLALLLFWPVIFLPGRTITIPVAMVLVTTLAYTGGRVGLTRGGDLLRYVGARGRLEVTSPSRGAGVKLIDTSALIDGRLVDIARAGFLDGTLVVPRFVLAEMQSMSDVEDPRRRNAARRGLDALSVLQDEGVIAVEVTDDDIPGLTEVDAKLAQMCRDRKATLVTVDANLARVAEISGVRVLNVHQLADALRSPVVPGDRIDLRILKEGRETGQGVGYLEDGTMVVVERAAEAVGETVIADITSVMQNRHGRMLFAARAPEGAR